MSQHNIARRLKALEREFMPLVKAGTAHLGCVPIILTEDELNAFIKDINQWNPTDIKGTLLTTPVCIDELAEGLRTGQYLIMNGIGRIQIIED